GVARQAVVDDRQAGLDQQPPPPGVAPVQGDDGPGPGAAGRQGGARIVAHGDAGAASEAGAGQGFGSGAAGVDHEGPGGGFDLADDGADQARRQVGPGLDGPADQAGRDVRA